MGTDPVSQAKLGPVFQCTQDMSIRVRVQGASKVLWETPPNQTLHPNPVFLQNVVSVL